MANEESSEKEEARGPLSSSQAQDQDEEESIEPEILKKIPPEARQIVEFGMTRVGPVPNPLLRKITPEHIDKILDLSGKEGDRAFQGAQSSRRYTLTYVGIGTFLFLFLTIYLAPMDKQLYLEIVKNIVLFSGGFGSGIGVKTYWDRSNT